MASVLQDWVVDLPLREQGTLLTAVRGCDLAPKTDQNLLSPERVLAAYIRWCFMHPADPREVDSEPGCWFRSEPPQNFRPSSVMHYPLHWYSHVLHALEVIAYRHPDQNTASTALGLYKKMASALHLDPESAEAMTQRLTEDRIANKNIVS